MGSVKSLTSVIRLGCCWLLAALCSGRWVRRKNERRPKDGKDGLREVGLIYRCSCEANLAEGEVGHLLVLRSQLGRSVGWKARGLARGCSLVRLPCASGPGSTQLGSGHRPGFQGSSSTLASLLRSQFFRLARKHLGRSAFRAGCA